MKLNKEERNKKYKHILSGLYAAEEIKTNFYICHALDFCIGEYKKLLEDYPELEILFPEDFTGKPLTPNAETRNWKEEDYALREIILLFAIEMTT
jgi:hypothetical protein